MLDAWCKNDNRVSSHPPTYAISKFLLISFSPFYHHAKREGTHGRRAGALVRTKNGLGISSLSGSQTGGSPFSPNLSFSAILAANALPFGSGLRLPSSMVRPPALACANSTSVRPLGAMFVPLVALIMLFLVAILLRSSVFETLDLRLDFRGGDNGTFS
jgi:hypothetical protein